MAGKKHGGWTFWHGLNSLLTLVTVVGIPVALLAYGWKIGGKRSFDTLWWPLGISGLGLIAVLSRYLYVKVRDPDEFRDLKSEVKFVLVHAHSAWSFAGGIACVLIGVFFCFPREGASLFERYDGALGIYVSVIGVTLAVHAFYRHTAPITDVTHLLERLIHDLNHCSETSKLWFVYPAMNLGYYRYHFAGTVDDDHISTDFCDALRRCAGKLKSNACVITYPQSSYETLYAAYDRMVRNVKEADKARYIPCAESADDFVHQFVDRGKRGTFYEFPPEEFPPQVIVIGSVTYVIVSYGLPYFENGTFTFPGDPAKNGAKSGDGKDREKALAKLYVFRRDDAALSSLISAQLTHLLIGRTPNTPTHRKDAALTQEGGAGIAKPAEAKPAEAKPAEAKPAEAKENARPDA